MTKERARVRASLYKAQRGRCGICKRRYALPDLFIDHINPASLGGASHATNYQLLCCVCNSTKRDLVPAGTPQTLFCRPIPRPPKRCRECGKVIPRKTICSPECATANRLAFRARLIRDYGIDPWGPSLDP